MNQLTEYKHDTVFTMAVEAIQSSPKLQPSTKKKYIRALESYTKQGYKLTDSNHLKKYVLEKGAGSSAVKHLQAGVSHFAREAIITAKSMASPDNLDMIQAYIYRFEALMNSIQAKSSSSQRVGTWLSVKELQKLIALTRQNGNSIQEIRDRVALGLLSQGMLRRTEAVSLTFSDLHEREGYFILRVIGKGNKKREVKISPALAQDIYKLKEVFGDGRILRSVLKDKASFGDSMSSQAVYYLVKRYGQAIDKEIQVHDLRRTGAKIAHQAGLPIEQISLALGHESIETTVLYLDIEQDWDSQPCDFVPY